MKMKYILFSLILICIIPVKLKGQSFRDGQIIINSDTIDGLIKKSNLQKYRDQVLFKRNPDDAPVKLSPDSIDGFIISKAYYRSTYLENNTMPQFLKLLVDGYASLLTTENSQQQDVYYFQKNDQPAKMYDKLHPWNFLTGFFYDCSEIRLNSNKRTYTKNELINLTMDYNRCVYPERSAQVIQSAKDVFNFSKGIKIGYSFNNFRTNQTTARNYVAENSIAGGIFLNLSYGGKLSFQPELLYIKRTASAARPISTLTEIMNYEVEIIQLPLLAKYTLAKGKFSPYLYAGPYIYIPLKLNGEKIRRTETRVVSTSELDLNYQVISLMAGLGLKVDFGNFDGYVDLRYDNNILSEGFNLTHLGFSSYQIFIGIGI